MTAIQPCVISAISGGAHRSWHYAHTCEERRWLIDELLGQKRGHVLFYAWDRPAGGETDEYPRHQLKIVYNGGLGAVHYSNGDSEHGPVGAWLAQADHPPADPPEVIFDPWDPDRVTLPLIALLPVDQLHEIADGYASTGLRPVAQWAPVEWV